MPKTKISEFDVDPANNTDINSINIAEGCAPSGINNAIRQLMSDLKEFQTGAGGDPFNGAVNGTVGATTPAAGTFTTVTANTSMSTDTISEKTSAAGVTVDGVLLKDNAVSASGGFTQNSTFNSASTMGFKNRIINGAMMIDQRNAGASVTADGNTVYGVDRFASTDNTDGSFTVQQSSTAPTGFNKSLLFTVASTDASLSSGQYARFLQSIEGLNVADLGWGTANASTVTLSFWVRSSVTGTFGAGIRNSAGNRGYPFSYTINSANTFEYKTVTIAGDTTGTWLTTNGIGLDVVFALGAGTDYQSTANTWGAGNYYSVSGATNLMATSGATFYITGVQLEKGSTATSFDYRPYGTELQLCQRYYERSYNDGVATGTGLADGWYGFASPTTSTENNALITFKVPKRVSPTMVVYNAISGASGAAYRVSDAVSVGITLARIGQNNVGVAYTASGNVNTYYYHWTASSEL